MVRIGRIGLILGMLALAIGAVGASFSLAEAVECGKDQTGLMTTGLGI